MAELDMAELVYLKNALGNSQAWTVDTGLILEVYYA